MNRRDAIAAIVASAAGSVLPVARPQWYVSRAGDALDWKLPQDLTIECQFIRYVESLADGRNQLTVSYRHKGEQEYRTVSVDGRRFDFFPGVYLTIMERGGFEFGVDRDEDWVLSFPYHLLNWQEVPGFMEFGEGHMTQATCNSSATA